MIDPDFTRLAVGLLVNSSFFAAAMAIAYVLLYCEDL